MCLKRGYIGLICNALREKTAFSWRPINLRQQRWLPVEVGLLAAIRHFASTPVKTKSVRFLFEQKKQATDKTVTPLKEDMRCCYRRVCCLAKTDLISLKKRLKALVDTGKVVITPDWRW